MTTKLEAGKVTLVATHESGTTIALVRTVGADCSRTFDMLRECGYVRIEVR
jgi:hypothetical protein